MLDEWVQRVKRLFNRTRPASAEQERDTRGRRHDLVVSLQQDVRQLQREISDQSDRENASGKSQAADVESERMRTLHRKLHDKQTELARYQARI